MAGTAVAIPACSLDTVEILAARLQARGQFHDTHARDRAHFFESEALFRLKPEGKGALWACVRESVRRAARCRRSCLRVITTFAQADRRPHQAQRE